MLAGSDGAYFLRYNKGNDSYSKIDVPGILPPNTTGYTDFWCINSGLGDGKMVFVILRKPPGNRKSVMEFRMFDPSLTEDSISDILMEVSLPPKAQRLTVLRVDNTFNVNRDAKKFIVAHKKGATIYDVVPNNICKDTTEDFKVKDQRRAKNCQWAKKRKKKKCPLELKNGYGKVQDMCPATCGTECP